MKKSLIPILSLLFIISLDSCKKDSDNQPVEDTHVVKTRFTHSSSPTIETTIFEYDESGRIISIKDSVDPYQVTISYVGDEAILTETSSEQGNYFYSARYKLNGDHLPIQRISAEGTDAMTSSTNPYYQVYTDTCKFEYDAAGLLLKAIGSGYDTTWSRYNNNTQTRFTSRRKAYTIKYTNEAGKLMAVKIDGASAYSSTQVGGSSYKSADITEDIYSLEYTKNYANKVDNKNAWLFIETGTLYDENFPMIKYANIPDKVSYTKTTTDVETGYVQTSPTQSHTREVEYLPSGYVSSITYTRGTSWNTTSFTYNK